MGGVCGREGDGGGEYPFERFAKVYDTFEDHPCGHTDAPQVFFFSRSRRLERYTNSDFNDVPWERGGGRGFHFNNLYEFW